MKLFILISIALGFVALSDADEHPHGKQIKILSFDGIEQIKSEALDQILLHPEVKDRKIVSLSITGAFRKGKSFFLDYCLRFLYANYKSVNTMSRSFSRNPNWWGEPNEPLTGFSWKHGREGDTKGILIWNDTFLYEENGDKVAILLMDTQGLFEVGRSSEIDVKILGITSFLSSIEILNMHAVIQEDQLEHLKMVTDFSKVTVQRQNEKSLDKSSKPFQELIFLVRDFIDDKIGYGLEGGRKYFNSIFNNSEPNNTKEAESVRKNIQNSFDHVYAVALPHPGTKVTRSTYDGRWSVLDKEFKEHLKNIIPSLFAHNKLIKKKILGSEVTGEDLAAYAATLFKAFDSFDIPQADLIFNAVVKIEMEKLLEPLMEEYKNKTKSKLDYDRKPFLKTLFDNHKNLQKSIIKKFKETPKIADKIMEKIYVTEISARTLEFFDEWKEDKVEHYKKLQELKILEAAQKNTPKEIEDKKKELEQQLVDFKENLDKELERLLNEIAENEKLIQKQHSILDELKRFDFDEWFV